MVDFKTLFEYQKFDLAIDEIESKIQQIVAKLEKFGSDVKKEEELLKNKDALLKKITLRKRKNETETAEANEKVKIIDMRMKNAGVSPDTYMALQKEGELLKEKISKLETQILEDMEKIETLQKDTEKSAKVLMGRKSHLEEVKQKNAGQTVDLKKEKELLLTQKRQASLGIPADLLELYEELRRKLKGQVVWEADTTSCPACGMNFNHGFIVSIVGCEGAEPCNNCGVLIHWTGILDGAHLVS